MTDSTHNLFQTLLSQWLESGSAPDAPIEAVSPEFANLLSTQPIDFTFDALFHAEDVPDWSWKAIEFDEVFDGHFFFYSPAAWTELKQQGPHATLGDASTIHQSIYLTTMALWQIGLAKLLEETKVLAFAYYPLHRPGYHQWVFVTAANGADDASLPVWPYGVYSAGEWLVIVKGDAPTADDLKCQLTSLINSNPWHGWIKAARAK